MTDSAATPPARSKPPADAETVLEIDSVYKHFGGIRAVNGAGFSVPKGSITALIGPNGAGKTTLFNIVTGFYQPDAGRILYEGESIFGQPAYRIARKGMVRTFQITKALAAMPVIDNMMLAAPHQPGESLFGLLSRRIANSRREKEVAERAQELLETFSLDNKQDDYAGTLSGGQRKLLELARALMAEPRTVLLDEPMAGINPTLGRRLLEHMHDLRENQGVTFVFIEHDMEVVMNHSDEVVVMAQGETIVKGLPEDVRTDQRVIDAYLGGGSRDKRGPEARRGAIEQTAPPAERDPDDADSPAAGDRDREDRA